MKEQKLVKTFFLLVVLPWLLLLTGCGGGVAGEGTNTYTLTGGTPVVRGNSFNDKGWDLLAQGQAESAIAEFQKVLGDSPTAEEQAEANNGMGWARSRLGTLADGITWFEKAAPLSNDAKVGLAAAYVQRGSREDMQMVVDLLYTALGGANPHFHYVATRNTGVSDAECHAMLGYAFAALGRTDDALAQMDYAKELNPNWTGTTIDQLSRAVDFLVR